MVAASFRSVIVLLALALIPAGAWAADYGYAEKMNAIALKPGYHFYPDNDFFDFWDIDREDMQSLMFEAAYERKLNRYLGLELGLGYFSSSEDYRNVLYDDDSSDIEIENWYLSASLKGYLPVCEYFYLYAGGGPDIYHTRGDYTYKSGNSRYSADEETFSFGAHALAGMEVMLVPDPGPDVYDAPVGLFAEFRYSWVEVKDPDEDVIDDINDFAGTNFGSNDLDVGGSQIMLGLRWHF